MRGFVPIGAGLVNCASCRGSERFLLLASLFGLKHFECYSTARDPICPVDLYRDHGRGPGRDMLPAPCSAL